MSQEYIEIKKARENNLKNISVRTPKRKITIFTGVSGSGKSSIVFDTIATEAKRQEYETLSMFVRNFLPKYSQPDADAIENLSMAIVVDQKRMGGGSHSTMGTVTDIYTVLRLIFSRVGKPSAGQANVFSFNDPQGMCQNCNGLGRKLDVDMDKFLDTSKSLNDGAILFPEYAVNSWGWSLLINTGLFDADKIVSEYTSKEMDDLKRVAAKQQITIEPQVFAGFPEHTADVKRPELLWAALSSVDGLLRTAVQAKVTAIHALETITLTTNTPVSNNADRLAEIPVQIELTASGETMTKLLAALPLRGDELRASGFPDAPVEKPPLFIDRVIIRKQSPEKTDEIRVFLRLVAFVTRESSQAQD